MAAPMIPYLLAVYVHILASVLWIGYILFWTILIGPLTRQFEPTESAKLARFMNQAAWPPGAIPVPYHVRFGVLGWWLLLALIVSGGFLLYTRGYGATMGNSEGLVAHPFGQLLVAKLSLVFGLIICQLLLSFRTTPTVIYFSFFLGLAVVAASVFLVRS